MIRLGDETILEKNVKTKFVDTQVQHLVGKSIHTMDADMDVFTVMACFRLKVIMIHGSILDLRKELIERISNDISTLKRADDIGNIQDIFLG